MSEQEYEDLWHYSEQFIRDRLQRSELATMAWREGERDLVTAYDGTDEINDALPFERTELSFGLPREGYGQKYVSCPRFTCRQSEIV